MVKKRFQSSILMLTLTILGTFVLGAFIFMALEGWHFIDAFYFVSMTATTVGYGDFTPTTKLSKIITIIYSLSIVPFVLYTFSIIAKYQTERVYNKIHNLEKKQDKHEKELEKTTRKIREQKQKIREQEEQLESQHRKLLAETSKNKKQEETIQEHEIELEGQDAELEVLEDIMEEALEKKPKKKKK